MITQLKIEYVNITALSEAVYNPRVITKKEFKGLVASIKTFGLVDPIIINADNTIIGGHQRKRAAAIAGYDEVPCVRLNLDKAAEAKLNVILNSQEISGKYDDVKLAELLEDMKLDDDYFDLRLNELEPLDLSEKQEDKEEPRNVYTHVWMNGDLEDHYYLEASVRSAIEDSKQTLLSHYEYDASNLGGGVRVVVWMIRGGHITVSTTEYMQWLEFTYYATSDTHPVIDTLMDIYTGILTDVENLTIHPLPEDE